MEPQQPTTTPPQPPIPSIPPTPQIKNSLLSIMSVLLIVTVAIAGLFYFQIQKLSKELSKYQTQPSPTPTATPDPTANWKTYTNEVAAFSFKYPSEIILKTGEKDLYWVDSSGNFQTNISWNFFPLTGTLEQELTSRDQCPIEVTNGIVPGPIPNSLRCDFVKSHYASVNIWVANEKKVYKTVIGAVNPNEPIPDSDINLLNQILSTFKFTNSTSASKSTACEKAGGTWLDQYQECENFTSNDQFCKENGGKLFECESPCRHKAGAGVCIQVCVVVCKF